VYVYKPVDSHDWFYFLQLKIHKNKLYYPKKSPDVASKMDAWPYQFNWTESIWFGPQEVAPSFSPIKTYVYFDEDLQMLGLKSAQFVKSGKDLFFYAGEVIGENEKNFLDSIRQGDYVATLYDKDKNGTSVGKSKQLFVNAKERGGAARMINHQCLNQNTTFYQGKVGTHSVLYVRAIDDILPNEKISVSYVNCSEELDKRFNYIAACLCKETHHHILGNRKFYDPVPINLDAKGKFVNPNLQRKRGRNGQWQKSTKGTEVTNDMLLE